MKVEERNDPLEVFENSAPSLQCSENLVVIPVNILIPVPASTDVVIDIPEYPVGKNAGFLFYLSYFAQILLPYLLSGVGSCGTGLYLHYLQSWTVFKHVPQLFILMPPLLNLNGNLVVTMASRLSTAASLGRLDGSHRWKAVGGNLSLVLCFGILIGLMTTVLALVISSFQGGFNLDHALIVASTGIGAVIVASFLLCLLAILIVFVSLHFGINPDNISASIVSTMGDITMQGSVSFIAFLIHSQQDPMHRLIILLGIYLVAFCILLVTFYTANHNKFTSATLKTGWCALIISTFFTTGGGMVLQKSLDTFKDLAIFQPSIAGLGGNLISVHASRIATDIQKISSDKVKIWKSPISVFFKNNLDSHAAKMLVLMILIGHTTNAYALHFLSGQNTVLSNTIFLVFYLGAAIIQVSLLIYVGSLLVHALWRFALSPDDNAIPLLVAMADLLGSSLLLLAFHLFHTIYPHM